MIAAEEAVTLSKDVQFDLNRAFVTSNFLVTQQDKLAQSRGDVALGFIQIYKALGGGWEIRLPSPATPVPDQAVQPAAPEMGGGSQIPDAASSYDGPPFPLGMNPGCSAARRLTVPISPFLPPS